MKKDMEYDKMEEKKGRVENKELKENEGKVMKKVKNIKTY